MAMSKNCLWKIGSGQD